MAKRDSWQITTLMQIDFLALLTGVVGTLIGAVLMFAARQLWEIRIAVTKLEEWVRNHEDWHLDDSERRKKRQRHEHKEVSDWAD